MSDNEEIVNGEETVSGEEIINKENTEAAGEPVSPETASSVILSEAKDPTPQADALREEGDSSGEALGMTDPSPAEPALGSDVDPDDVAAEFERREAEETASPVQGEVASEAEPRMTEGLLASDKPQSDSNADNPSVSDGAAVLDSSPYTGEPAPAAADSPAPAAADETAADETETHSPALDYVGMTLSAGVAPLEMRFAQINSCYRRLPIAYRSFTYINSVIEGVIPPEKYAYAAEDAERGERLARWNVAKAIEAAQTFEAFDRNVEFVTARVPASLTRVPDMYAWMKSLLERHGLTEHPERLCLEFPRTLLYEDVETARPALLALKLLKVRTLVSGIGERDCPVTALAELPVDMVLLAPRISAFSDNRDKGQVFTAFVNFLRSLPVDVIGDGLYNDDQITIHSRADCTGYIPSSGYEGSVQHGSLRMKLEEAVEQKEEDL